MKAKEKALMLFHSFEEYVESKDTNDNVTLTDFKLQKENQKQCALICVDEILKSWREDGNGSFDVAIIYYWNEVKQEIEKL